MTGWKNGIEKITLIPTIREKRIAMKTKIVTAMLAGCLLFSSAFAGEYATALGKCLYDNTNAADKTTLTQWAFVSLGKTSAAKSIVTIPAEKTNAVDQQAQKLVTRLVATSCSKEATQVALHESSSGLPDAVVALSSRMLADQLKSQTKNTFSNSLISPEKTEQLMETGKALKNLFQK